MPAQGDQRQGAAPGEHGSAQPEHDTSTVTRPRLPRMGLGCATVGNLFHARSDEDAAALLDEAWEAGIRYFDTAPHYGLGLSERRLGAFLSTKPREEFVVSTKVGRLLRPNPGGAAQRDAEGFDVRVDLHREWDFTREGIRASLADSLDRFGLDRIDVLYLHDPERSGIVGAIDQAMPALVSLRDEGIVRRVGVGSMEPKSLLIGAHAGADLLMAANCYTLLNQGVYPEVLRACEVTGARLVPAAVFNSGVLASSPRPGAMFDYAEADATTLERVRRIEQVCRQYGLDLPTVALAYPLLDRRVEAIVVGADTGDQIHTNLARLETDVPDDLWTDLDERGLVLRCA